MQQIVSSKTKGAQFKGWSQQVDNTNEGQPGSFHAIIHKRKEARRLLLIHSAHHEEEQRKICLNILNSIERY